MDRANAWSDGMTDDHNPRLLAQLVEDTAGAWHAARRATDQAHDAFIAAVRRQVEAELMHRAAVAQYEAEQVPAC
jgi:hypothetical protein